MHSIRCSCSRKCGRCKAIWSVLADGGKPARVERAMSRICPRSWQASRALGEQEKSVRPTPQKRNRAICDVSRDLFIRATAAPRQVGCAVSAESVRMAAQPAVTPDRPPAPKLDPEIEKQCELQRQRVCETSHPAASRVHADLAVGVPPA